MLQKQNISKDEILMKSLNGELATDGSWTVLLKEYYIEEKDLEYFIDKFNVEYIFKFQMVSENFINKHINVYNNLQFSAIIDKQNVSLNFWNKNIKYLDMYNLQYLCMKVDLTGNFIKKHSKYFNKKCRLLIKERRAYENER